MQSSCNSLTQSQEEARIEFDRKQDALPDRKLLARHVNQRGSLKSPALAVVTKASARAKSIRHAHLVAPATPGRRSRCQLN
jgi:hypothetical protein